MPKSFLILKNFIIFIPLFLFTGPFIPDLIITFSSIFFIIYLFVKSKFVFLNNKFFIFFIYIWIVTLISSFLSFDITSIKSSISYLRFGLFAMLLLYLSKHDKNFLIDYEKVIFYSIIILFIDASFQYFVGFNLIGYEKDSRISSFFGEEKIMGSYIIKILPIFFTLYFAHNKKIFNIKFIFISMIALLLIILSNERSALFLYFLFYFLISIFVLKNFKKIFIFLITIFLITALLFASSERLKQRFILDTVNQLQIPSNEKKNYNFNYYLFTKNHDAFIKTAFNMFKDKPFLGHGNKQFRIKCNDKEYYFINKKISCNTHPHNYYAQALAEGGIILFSLLSFVFLYFCFILVKTSLAFPKNNSLLTIIIANIVMLWPFIPTGNFFNNYVSIFIYLNFSTFLILYAKKNKKDS